VVLMGGGSGGGAGGGGGAGAPYDLMGGQYANFSGGTPSGINWPGVLQDTSQALGQIKPGQATPIPALQTPQSGMGAPVAPEAPSLPLAQLVSGAGPRTGYPQPVPMPPIGGMPPGVGQSFGGGPSFGGGQSFGGGPQAGGGMSPDVLQLIQRLLG
jgi:hypothetical protein